MKTIGAFEAKTHLSELLDLAAVGERITITRRGKAVAMLVPGTRWCIRVPGCPPSGCSRYRTC
jgi:prevent-host-death family protein